LELHDRGRRDPGPARGTEHVVGQAARGVAPPVSRRTTGRRRPGATVAGAMADTPSPEETDDGGRPGEQARDGTGAASGAVGPGALSPSWARLREAWPRRWAAGLPVAGARSLRSLAPWRTRPAPRRPTTAAGPASRPATGPARRPAPSGPRPCATRTSSTSCP